MRHDKKDGGAMSVRFALGVRARIRRPLPAAVLALSISSLGIAGCLGIAGDFQLGEPDATTDATTGSDGAMEAMSTPIDAADARGEDGGPFDASDGDAREPDVIEEIAPPCTDGGACMLGPCLNGEYTCVGGIRVCQETVAVSNGTLCHSMQDAGEGGVTEDAGQEGGVPEVCYSGACVACNVGGDCSIPDSCQKRTINCNSGLPVCVDAGNQPDNSSCGTDLYCYGGVCSPCTVDASCTPTDAGCKQGRVTSCANGNSTCTVLTTFQPNGTQCGTNLVCDNGQCVTCYANTSCAPPDNICHYGTTSCATGTSQCLDLDASLPDNSNCDTPGENHCLVYYLCHSGTCVASGPIVCLAEDQCHVAGTCNPADAGCSNPPANSGTPCNFGNACFKTQTCNGSGTCTGTNPVMCNPTGCQAAGSCDPASGTCSYSAGGCTAGVGCQGAATCDPSSGNCAYVRRAESATRATARARSPRGRAPPGLDAKERRPAIPSTALARTPRGCARHRRSLSVRAGERAIRPPAIARTQTLTALRATTAIFARRRGIACPACVSRAPRSHVFPTAARPGERATPPRARARSRLGPAIHRRASVKRPSATRPMEGARTRTCPTARGATTGTSA
jgi:hypothetical protein